MENRLKLQEILEEILGSKEVYFQPPESIRMTYPAIRFNVSTIDHLHANNKKYIRNTSYTITLIDEDPESEFVDPILDMPNCRFDRSYPSGGLNHFVFTIFI